MKKLFTLVSAILFSSLAFAQIPNNSFEQWDTFATYVSPKYWDTPDSATDALTGHVIYTCEVDSPGAPGKYFLKLMSRAVPLPVTVVPGIAVSGKMDLATLSLKSGYAFTSRPHSLNGEWQFMASGVDRGHVAVFLSKWNAATSSRDTVAFVDSLLPGLPGMAMVWTPFTINLKYYSTAAPDSAIIVLSSSGSSPAGGSYLYIDSLTFAGSVLGAPSVNGYIPSIALFPNPTSGITNLSYASTAAGRINVRINDLSGRLIKEINTSTTQGDNNIPVNTSGFAPGIYFIKVVDEYGTAEKKLIVQ